MCIAGYCVNVGFNDGTNFDANLHCFRVVSSSVGRLQHGADPNKKNRDGHTPLDLVKEGDVDIQDLLRGQSGLVVRENWEEQPPSNVRMSYTTYSGGGSMVVENKKY